MSAKRYGIMIRLLVGLLPTVVLLTAAEAAMRVYYFSRHHHDWKYLIAPWGWKEPTASVAYPYKPERTYAKRDPCTERTITFTVNVQGGRGPAWSKEKPPATLRIMAIGASTTFGVNNPDEATWPAVLERVLKRQGAAVEVLNGGTPGLRLEATVHGLYDQILPYHPDIVLHYEAFNNAVVDRDPYHSADAAIERFHAYTWIGQLAARLYYRSMLYTYLLEKMQFERARRNKHIVPDIAFYQGQLRQLIRTLRSHHIRPVVVLQATELPVEPSFQHLDLANYRAVEGAILQATQHSPAAKLIDQDATDQRFTAMRVFQTQVLVEVARRASQAEGAQVLDPRPAFASYAGQEPLFCDIIHLTDAGNALLAETIAPELALPGGRTASVPGRLAER